MQFGIRVTNLSQNAYRFIFFGLMPELQDADGRAIQWDYARNATKAPKESDFLLAKPGESLTFFIDAELYWHKYKLWLGGDESSGGFWHFDDLKPGIYGVGFTYRNRDPVRQIYRGGSVEGLWTGVVSTLFVELRLVSTMI